LLTQRFVLSVAVAPDDGATDHRVLPPLSRSANSARLGDQSGGRDPSLPWEWISTSEVSMSRTTGSVERVNDARVHTLARTSARARPMPALVEASRSARCAPRPCPVMEWKPFPPRRDGGRGESPSLKRSSDVGDDTCASDSTTTQRVLRPPVLKCPSGMGLSRVENNGLPYWKCFFEDAVWSAQGVT
jgi:hypothetical protein